MMISHRGLLWAPFLSLLVFFMGCAGVETQNRLEKRSTDQDFHTSESDREGIQKKRVIVLPFKDGTDKIEPAEITRAENEFKRSLQKTGQVTVVEMEYEKQKGAPNAAETLKKTGVQAVLTGELEDLSLQRGGDQIGIFRQVKTVFIAKVRMKVLHGRTKRELMNTLKTVTVEDSNFRFAEKGNELQNFKKNPEVLRKVIAQAFNEFIPQVIDSLSGTYWEGRIAKLTSDRVYLNVGKVSGVQIGDLLKVYDEGEEIFDKGSGRFIGKAPGRSKGTLEITGFFGDDGSVAIVHSGAGFQEDDRVELYQ